VKTLVRKPGILDEINLHEHALRNESRQKMKAGRSAGRGRKGTKPRKRDSTFKTKKKAHKKKKRKTTKKTRYNNQSGNPKTQNPKQGKNPPSPSRLIREILLPTEKQKRVQPGQREEKCRNFYEKKPKGEKKMV